MIVAANKYVAMKIYQLNRNQTETETNDVRNEISKYTIQSLTNWPLSRGVLIRFSCRCRCGKMAVVERSK